MLDGRITFMPPKKISPQAAPFLKTAAEAIGTALGKLAVKTGVAAPELPRKRKAPTAAKKKAKSAKKSPAKKAAR